MTGREGDSERLVEVEIAADRVAVLWLQRPARRNALDLALKAALLNAIRAAEADASVAAIVLTGRGGIFAAGSDVAEMRDMTPISHVVARTGELFEHLRAATKPVIAAVEGYALGGGCELALACDMIVAGDDARFGQPEIRVGIMPGAGGTQMLSRATGRHRAMKLLLTGEPFSAADAFAMGIVSEVVPGGTALVAAIALATTIAAMPPLAVSAIRDAVRTGGDLPLTAALAYERRLFERLFASDDQVEGMQAFLDKRQPEYHGR